MSTVPGIGANRCFYCLYVVMSSGNETPPPMLIVCTTCKIQAHSECIDLAQKVSKHIGICQCTLRNTSSFLSAHHIIQLKVLSVIQFLAMQNPA